MLIQLTAIYERQGLEHLITVADIVEGFVSIVNERQSNLTCSEINWSLNVKPSSKAGHKVFAWSQNNAADRDSG